MLLSQISLWCLERLREGPFSRNLIWNFCLPPKVSFFCLGSVVGEILTMDKLKKMGRHLANRCPLCGKDGENIDHLFLHCMLARELYSLLFTIFDVK